MIKTKTGSLALMAGAIASVTFLLPYEAHAQEGHGQGSQVFYGVLFEQLEYRVGDESDLLAWDGDALIGEDEWKLRLQSTGEYELDHDQFEALEHQLAVQRMVSEFFDLKVGVRHDAPTGPDRTYGVIGLHGLAPQWVEVDADLFISEEGNISARLDADYALLLTNYLILAPTAEINVALSDDEEIGVGSGLSSAELSLRLSYDLIDRAVSPYVGVAYERKFGKTADYAESGGGETDEFFLQAGMRLMF